MKIKEIETLLLEHCHKMSILRRDASQKKKDSILDSLIAAIIRSETTTEELQEFLKDIENDKVLNIEIFEKGGHITNYINPKWQKLINALWRQRSVGLGTPNAASGEGELMFVFVSPHIIKPTRGDLKLKDETLELKGEGVRVSGKISGKEFRKLTLDIAKKWNLTPNISYRTELQAVEIEKIQHESHWTSELSKLDKESRKEFIKDYFKCIDRQDHDIDEIITENSIDFTKLKTKIVKVLYQSMVNSYTFDKFVLLGDGSEIKVISNDINKFNKDVDDGKILVLSDYFRINQDAPIGWYIA